MACKDCVAEGITRFRPAAAGAAHNRCVTHHRAFRRAAKLRAEAEEMLKKEPGPKPITMSGKPLSERTTLPRKRGAVPFEALKHMGVIKKALREVKGDDGEYYRILKGYGYDHADEIVDKEEARAIYKVMAGAHARFIQDAELQNMLTTACERLGVPRFMAILGAHGQESITQALEIAGDPLEDLLRELKQAVEDKKGTDAQGKN